MLRIAPIRMMLRQEIISLRRERDLDAGSKIEDLTQAACRYRDKLLDYQDVFDDRQASTECHHAYRSFDPRVRD